MKKHCLSILSLLVFLGCGGNPAFVKSPGEISKQMKRLLVLPIYVDSAFFPKIPADAKAQQYPEPFQRAVTKAVQEKLPLLNQVTSDIIQKNTLGLEIVMGNAEDLKVLQLSPVPSPLYADTGIANRNITYSWPFNRSWMPSKEGFIALLKKYQADGLLVQSLTVNRIWYNYSWSGGGRTQYSIIMPFDTVFYQPTIYNRQGSIVYGGERMDFKQFGGSKHYQNFNGNDLVFLQRATAAETKGYKAIPEDLEIIQKSLQNLDAQILTQTLTKPASWKTYHSGSLGGLVGN